MNKKCTLADTELHDAVQKWVLKLCDTGGMAWTLSVPVNFDRDPDMIITELCKRYAALLARHNALREAVAWERECLDTWEYGTALKMQALDEQVASMNAARDEVDRLLGDGSLDEAKNWMHECNELYTSISQTEQRYTDEVVDNRWDEINGNCNAAMAEVDRLVANETSADCKGEG